MATIDEESVRGLKAGYATDVAQIQASQLLTEQGKAAAIAKIYLETRAQLDKLRGDYAMAQSADVRALRRDIFGGPPAGDPAATVDWRDADRYADSLTTTSELLTVLQRCYDRDDTVLGAAVLRRAVQMAGADPLQQGIRGDVVELYDAMVPGTKAKLDQLTALEAKASSSVAGVKARLQLDGLLGLSKPTQISGLTDSQIHALAEQA